MEKEDIKQVRQEEIHNLLFNREVGWQEIIYDLINTEQLDPWNVDITILTEKYLEKINALEETDFFISSKVLLAAALLLRIKSEILLNKQLKSIDEVLFGNGKDKKTTVLEKIELDEDIPELIPRSPMPRFKKVSLDELMEALNKAIVTENRRIKKEIVNRNALRETSIFMPKKQTISIKDKIGKIHLDIKNYFKTNKKATRISYTEFIGKEKEERVLSFYPLLHLENQQKIWLSQENHFDEIYIWLKDVYLKHNPDPFLELKEELQEEIEKLDKNQRKRFKKIEGEFSNPLGDI